MSNSSIVVLISADQEWHAVQEFYSPGMMNPSPYGEWFDQRIELTENIVCIRFLHGGWGKIAAAASTQYVIGEWHPELLINLGTCGGFDGFIKTEDVVLVDETIVYDIYEKMFDPDAAINSYKTGLDLSWLEFPYPQKVIKTKMVSADRDLIPSEIVMLHERFGAIAGDWESGAIAYVASHNHIRCLILRGVSDIVTAHGSDAYQNTEVFTERTKKIMFELLGHLPAWLTKCICRE